MIVHTTNRPLLGHQVLTAPSWIKRVSWPEARVSVNLPRQAANDAAPYDATARLEGAQEAVIRERYGPPAIGGPTQDAQPKHCAMRSTSA